MILRSKSKMEVIQQKNIIMYSWRVKLHHKYRVRNHFSSPFLIYRGFTIFQSLETINLHWLVNLEIISCTINWQAPNQHPRKQVMIKVEHPKHGVWTKRISTPSIMELHLANVEGKNVHLDKPIRHEGNWNLGTAHLHRTLHTLVRGLISNPFNLSHRHIFSRGDPLSFRQSTWAIFTIVFYY